MNRKNFVFASILIAIAPMSTVAWSQTSANKSTSWPTKALRLVVGFPAGSSPDLTARTLAEPLSAALGQPVIVENKVGAGGNIAADYVAKATDGHTLGLMINGNLSIAKLLNPQLSYDPLKDLAPISLIGVSPLVLTVPVDAPGHTAQEFLAYARQGGDKLSYGTPGVGTVGHIGMELLKEKTGINPVHVPYPGYPQVANAMLGGQLQLALLPPALAQAQIKAGKLRAVGLTSSGRSTLAPELPSLAEMGVKDFNLEIWNAIAAPASLPKPVQDQLSALLGSIARSPDIRQKLFHQGWQVVGSSAQGLALRMQSDKAVLGAIIARRSIKPE
jgi:tripartite-type tricarboxylate transporter receptor subunit TctC